jgi:hypothetical protein
MGYNTVAFLLNDFMHELSKSPKSATFLLTHPPMSEDDKRRMQQTYYHRIPEENGEPSVHTQALEILPTFHADEQKFFLAGGNCIVDLKQPVKFGMTKDGKKTVTLELPDWFEPRWWSKPRPKAWPKSKY